MDGTYDLTLVFESCWVAALAAYAAFDLGGRIALFDVAAERFWLAIGALVVGSGLWSMHFIGMRALAVPAPMNFDLELSLLSWAAAVLVSLLALYLISREELGTAGIAGGGAVMGVGLCVMHYSGVFALRLTPAVRYDSELFSASMFIAILVSITMLLTGQSLRDLPLRRMLPGRLFGALLLGAALCGMHYVGMAAAEFPAGVSSAPDNTLRGNWIGLPLAGFVACMTVAVLLLSMLDALELKVRRRVAKERFEARFRGRLARG
ncbi:MHYT domain-containing protein [Nevskia soli]|uniref:MHYT domain-containing protein n=1 Tax=Nevskia soli TaxID=418856 RepID=UPI00069170DB|nr:MHYT domain-containing protein [Nevskia soli]